MAIKKPNLGCGNGCMVDSKFLPAELRKVLMDLIEVETELPKNKIDAFLDDRGEAAQMMVEDREQIGLGEQQKQLEVIATNAHRLLASINAANEKSRETLTAHSEYLAFGSSPPVKLPRKVIADVRVHGTENTLLALAWDYVQALEQAAQYAAEQIVPSKQAKPEQINGTRLAAFVVDAYWQRFNALPPINQAGWFAGFMKYLGDHYKVACGPRIVNNVITQKGITLMGEKTRSA